MSDAKKKIDWNRIFIKYRVNEAKYQCFIKKVAVAVMKEIHILPYEEQSNPIQIN